jgi:hypothetical protein
MKKLLMLCLFIATPSLAFNLITDIEQQTTFPIGQAASAGTAVNLRNGSLSVSALAELSNYRMISFWYGGTFVNPSDGSMTDTAKIGLNIGYFLTGFVNRPPLLFQNIVVGPSFAMSIISTPRVGTPFFDINYRFGGTTALPPAVTPTPVTSAPAP